MGKTFIIGRRIINDFTTNKHKYEYVLSEESNYTFPMEFDTIEEAKDFMKKETEESIEDIEKNYVFHDSIAYFIEDFQG